MSGVLDRSCLVPIHQIGIIIIFVAFAPLFLIFFSINDILFSNYSQVFCLRYVLLFRYVLTGPQYGQFGVTIQFP